MFRLTVINNNYSDNNIYVSSNSKTTIIPIITFMFRLTVINNNYSDNNIYVSSNSNKQQLF